MSIFSRLIHRIGHRGAFLAFLALLDLLYGYAILAEPGPVDKVTYIFPIEVWGFIWLVAGIIILSGVFVRHDRVHFGVAASVKALWAAAWVDVWVFQHVPRAWVSVVLWAAFSALVVVVSSWPEVRRRNHNHTGEDGKANE